MIERGAISQKGSLFSAMNPVSRKQSEEPESTSPSKTTETSGEWKGTYSDLVLVKAIAPKYRVGSLACLKQSAPGGVRGLLVLFLEIQVQWGCFPVVQHTCQ